MSGKDLEGFQPLANFKQSTFENLLTNFDMPKVWRPFDPSEWIAAITSYNGLPVCQRFLCYNFIQNY